MSTFGWPWSAVDIPQYSPRESVGCLEEPQAGWAAGSEMRWGVLGMHLEPQRYCAVHACAGIVPSLVQMFLVFPLSTPFGVGGVGLGALTPVFVLIFNTIGWGIPAYAWFRLAGEGSMPPHTHT